MCAQGGGCGTAVPPQPVDCYGQMAWEKEHALRPCQWPRAADRLLSQAGVGGGVQERCIKSFSGGTAGVSTAGCRRSRYSFNHQKTCWMANAASILLPPSPMLLCRHTGPQGSLSWQQHQSSPATQQGCNLLGAALNLVTSMSLL